jgi:hypothetical protein
MKSSPLCQQGCAVLHDLRSGGACGAEAPLPAFCFDLAALREHGFGLFRTEMRLGRGRREETEHVIDRADIVPDLLKKRRSGGLFFRGADGIKPFLSGGLDPRSRKVRRSSF